MLKKICSFIGFVSMLGSALLADEIIPAVDEKEALKTEPSAATKPPTKITEAELTELVGYLTALKGNFSVLKLDKTGITALANGFEKGLNGEWNPKEFPKEMLEAALDQVRAREKLIGANAEDLPDIDVDALQKIGFVAAINSGFTQYDFSEDEILLIKKGFISGSGATTGHDPQIRTKMPAFREFIHKRTAAARTEMLVAEKQAETKAFFDSLNEDVQNSKSGLYYKIIEPGKGKGPTLEDTVLVHYKGTLIDGTLFDSSYDSGEPAEFPLKGAIPGFSEGLAKIGEGGKIILYIPSELGYGNSLHPSELIKPGDTLIFECELIEINPGI